MVQESRQNLKVQFDDGERPSGQDFANLIDSFPNFSEDSISRDNEGNISISEFVLGSSSHNVRGGLRYNYETDQLQFHNGTNWGNLASGSGGVFRPVGDSNSVIYNQGSVGIGTLFSDDVTPNFLLDVADAVPNNQAIGRARFGAMVCGSGPSPNVFNAVLAHQDFSNQNDFGFEQDTNGNVRINSPDNGTIGLWQNGLQVRLMVSDNGNVVIGNNSDDFSSHVLQVHGTVYKSEGGGSWDETSDIRVKEDIRDLEVGLEQLRQVRPVRFRYNGNAGTPAGKEGIGIIGQEIETILPETIQHVPSVDGLGSDDPLRIYNGSALTYVLVNAVKELAARVEQLEAALADARQGRSSS